jgi:transketolase
VAEPKTAPEKASLKQMADAIRVLAMDGVEKANSGHPGMPMGMADVATVLFSKFLKFDASRPDWADRDRFILSAGHGSMLIYALLHLTGYKAATKEQLSSFRQWGSKTAGHPEYGHMPGWKPRRVPWVRVWPMPLASPWPSVIWPPASVGISSITAPGSSPATAA